jgi:hypothetical protein
METPAECSGEFLDFKRSGEKTRGGWGRRAHNEHSINVG